MKSHAQVVVIGGGVVGVSILYHLTKAGWHDVVLIERSELTSGSTWHAAGGCHTLNSDPQVAKLQSYTIDLYKEIEEISGQETGFRLTGGVFLAATPERMELLKVMQSQEKLLGIDTELLTPTEAEKILPLINPKEFLGALYTPPCTDISPLPMSPMPSPKRHGFRVLKSFCVIVSRICSRPLREAADP